MRGRPGDRQCPVRSGCCRTLRRNGARGVRHGGTRPRQDGALRRRLDRVGIGVKRPQRARPGTRSPPRHRRRLPGVAAPRAHDPEPPRDGRPPGRTDRPPTEHPSPRLDVRLADAVRQGLAGLRHRHDPCRGRSRDDQDRVRHRRGGAERRAAHDVGAQRQLAAAGRRTVAPRLDRTRPSRAGDDRVTGRDVRGHVADHGVGQPHPAQRRNGRRLGVSADGGAGCATVLWVVDRRCRHEIRRAGDGCAGGRHRCDRGRRDGSLLRHAVPHLARQHVEHGRFAGRIRVDDVDHVGAHGWRPFRPPRARLDAGWTHHELREGDARCRSDPDVRRHQADDRFQRR